MAANPAIRPDGAALLALALTPGLGPTRARKLAEHFGSAENVFLASLTELEACGLHAAAAQAIGTGKSAQGAQEELRKAADARARILTRRSRVPVPAAPDLRSAGWQLPGKNFVRVF